MDRNSTAIRVLNLKIGDLFLVNILSALLIAVIAYFPNSPVRIILGLPFILFFPGYTLICALFPRKNGLDWIERLALSMGLSIAISSLIGLALSYTPFGIRLYPVLFSLFSFILLISAVAIYMRTLLLSTEDVFAPLASLSISRWRELESSKKDSRKSINDDSTLKIFAIITSIFVILVLIIIARTPPASGYELSIYDAFPWYFWALLVSIFLLVIGITLYRIFFSSITSIDSNWLYLWFTALLAYFILFLLPFFRGYLAYGLGDTASHIGYCRDIMATGGVPCNNYPISHILVAILGYITAIDIKIFVITLPALFAIFYIFWVSKLGEVIFKEKALALVLLVTIFALFLHYERLQQFAPFTNSLFVLPLFLYVFFNRRGSLSYTIILVILIIMLPFLHIFLGVALTIALLALWFSEGAWEKLSGLKIKSRFFVFYHDLSITKKDYSSVFLLMCVVMVWYAVHCYYHIVGDTLSMIFFPAEVEGEPIIHQTLDALAEAGLTSYETIRVFWTRMANTFFFYLLPLILFVILIFLSIYRNFRLKIDKKVFQFVVLYFTFFLLSILFLFMIEHFTYSRIGRVVVVSSIIISSLMIWELISCLSHKKKKAVFVALLLIVCFLMVTNIFTVFRSPISTYANEQAYLMELDGVDWYFGNVLVITNKVRANTALRRYSHLLYGIYSGRGIPIIYREQIPDEFGYGGNETIADSFGISNDEQSTTYMVLTQKDLIYYKIFFKHLWDVAISYSEANIEKLNNDRTANKFYSNGEFTIWLIKR